MWNNEEKKLAVRVIAWTVAIFMMPVTVLDAQMTDMTQTPNAVNAGIRKSLADQIGTDRGTEYTPDSSTYIIKRDPARSIRRGRQLFQRKFTKAQGLGPRMGDGVGDIAANGVIGAGLVDSCAGCHGRPKGSAGAGGDVFTRPDSRDAPHLFGLGLVEMMADEITSDLRAIRSEAIASAKANRRSVNKQLISKRIDYGSITALPDGTVDTSSIKGVNPDLRVRPFFADGRTISIREFAVGALNAEMGLQAPDPDLLAASQGGRVLTPSGMVLDGSTDVIEAPPVSGPLEDKDGDGVVNEIPTALVDHLEFYLLNYFKPGLYEQTETVEDGLKLFRLIGCTDCHVQNLAIRRDRRVADVETVYDSVKGIFNSLFATASLLITEKNDGLGLPTLKQPKGQCFPVKNIFADFKRHDLGPEFHERNFDGTITKELMTEPLWGVGTTAPYGHDGRSVNLKEVILRHGGEARKQRDAFARLSDREQRHIIEFLQSLVLFPPDDTASNLDPGNRSAPNFPQQGHGSISLTVLFNNPGEIE
jgi:hypothetical protein